MSLTVRRTKPVQPLHRQVEDTTPLCPYISNVALGTEDRAVDSAGPTRSNRRLALVLLGLAVLLATVSAVGLFTRFSYIWPQRLLAHPMLFGAVAGGLAGLGLAQLLRARLMAGVVLGLFLASLGWAAAWAVTSLGPEEVERVEGEEFTAVVELGGFVDPEWYIYIQPASPGLLDRAHSVGCVNGDWQHLEEVSWVNSKLRIVTDQGGVAVALDDQGRRASIEYTDDKPEEPQRLGPILGGCS